MIFRPDPSRKYFELGILRAPQHAFRIEVREISPAGVSSFFVPLESVRQSETDLWSFELGSSSNQGVSFYQNGSFDRKSGIGDARDFRWAVDLEGDEFYNQPLTTKTNQLGPVMRLTQGEFYTKTKTRPLLRNKGNGTFEYFGSAADEIAADVFLDAGDVVLRSSKSGKEILRLKEKLDTTYEIVVENEPLAAMHGGSLSSSFNHFRYYYRLIAKPNAEWYGFKLASDEGSSATPDFNHAKTMFAAYRSPSTFGTPRTLCMLVGVGKRKGSLR